MYPCIISSLCISKPIELGIEVINYWFHRKQELISQRFTNDFIIESIKFLLNNNVLFDDHMYLYLLGTAMSTKCAPVCLFNCRLAETKLFINKLPKYFNKSECKLIMELLKRYMDDGLCFGHQLLHDRGPYDIETSPLIC